MIGMQMADQMVTQVYAFELSTIIAMFWFGIAKFVLELGFPRTGKAKSLGVGWQHKTPASQAPLDIAHPELSPTMRFLSVVVLYAFIAASLAAPVQQRDLIQREELPEKRVWKSW